MGGCTGWRVEEASGGAVMQRRTSGGVVEGVGSGGSIGGGECKGAFGDENFASALTS